MTSSDESDGDDDDVNLEDEEYNDDLAVWTVEKEDVPEPPWYGEDLLQMILKAENGRKVWTHKVLHVVGTILLSAWCKTQMN